MESIIIYAHLESLIIYIHLLKQLTTIAQILFTAFIFPSFYFFLIFRYVEFQILNEN